MVASDLAEILRKTAARLLEIATDERDIDSASLIGLASDLMTRAGDLDGLPLASQAVGSLDRR